MQMVINMRVNGRIVNFMEKEFIFMRMGINSKVSMLIIKGTEKDIN